MTLTAALLVVGCVVCARMATAQPIDIMVPDAASEDSLSQEMRRMDAITRDLAIDRLRLRRGEVEALVALGELRMNEGKLDEARRFFEMALERRPNDLNAGRGLAASHYKAGRFGDAKMVYDRLLELYPISDALRREVDRVRQNLNHVGELGLEIREDSRGFQEITGFGELYSPSFSMPRLSARYRLDSSDFSDGRRDLNTRRFSGTGEYAFDHRSKLGLTFAPETIDRNQEVGGYDVYGSYGSERFHLSSHAGRRAFRENIDTLQAGLVENYLTLTLLGELHPRTRVSQSVTATNLSDDNTRQRWDTEVLHFIYRQGVPLLSLDLRLFQAGYERVRPVAGGRYPYWAASDHRGTTLTAGWERGVGSRWWWGCDLFGSLQNYRDTDNLNAIDVAGGGFKLHASHRFHRGRLYAEFVNSFEAYYRERRLGIYGSVEF